MKRDLITIDDLSNSEIESIFELADDILLKMGVANEDASPPFKVKGRLNLAEDCILAALFHEPSTRTKFSFESAMIRLGGSVLSFDDPATTSIAKGETIADTVRVIQNYSDLIVIRHPWEGAAQIAAEYTDIPVINAGDGSHEHPTQTLCDLYTLRREKKSLADLNVLLCGDLKNGRTIHSLVYALARFGANIIPAPAQGLELPSHVTNRLRTDYHCYPVPVKEFEDMCDGLFEGMAQIDVLYITPERAHQQTVLPLPEFQLDLRLKVVKNFKGNAFDVCYVTRLQNERLTNGENGNVRSYPIVDSNFLKEKKYKATQVLHPLPRVDELSYDLDNDPRGAYFKQASYGVPLRMALMATLLHLNAKSHNFRIPVFPARRTNRECYAVYSRSDGILCSNLRCVTNQESERRYLLSKFWVVLNEPLTIRCSYCEFETQPELIGNASSRTYSTDTFLFGDLAADDRVIFSNKDQARDEGFHAGAIVNAKGAEIS